VQSINGSRLTDHVFAGPNPKIRATYPIFRVYTLARKLDVLLYVYWGPNLIGLNLESRPVFLNVVEEVRVMEARTPVRVMYACGLVIVGTVLFLMIYSGMLEGVGEAIFDFVKEIVKFFIG
jgi:hypothetical protein